MATHPDKPERTEAPADVHEAIASATHSAALLDAVFALARESGLMEVVAGAHVIRIRRIVEEVAARLGQSSQVAEKMGYDAMWHDVGKLTVPPSLLAPGPLTDERRQALQAHTVRGYEMLSSDESLMQAAQIARSHHESWDGSGYPDGLAGDAIPLAARITAAADALDDLLCGDDEHAGASLPQALDNLTELAGACFDPVVIETLRMCYAEGALNEIYDTPPRRADAA